MADPQVPYRSYYEPLDPPAGDDPGYEYFQPTEAAASVWSPAIQHGGPPNGLLVRAMDRQAPDDGLAFSRVSMEILGGIGFGVNRVKVEIPRPGRQITKMAAVLEERLPGGEYRAVARCRAWRLRQSDTSAITTAPQPPLPATPDLLPQTVGFPDLGDTDIPWGRVGFIGTTVTAQQPGRTGDGPAIWIKPAIPLVTGETPSALESIFTVADVANGIGSNLDPRVWTWMNMDTTVHLITQPTSPWLGIDSQLAIGSDGHGASFADLYDIGGFLGRSAQTVMLTRTSR